jgi:hypothetical protein
MRTFLLVSALVLLLPSFLFSTTAEEYYQAALALYKQKDYEQAFRYYEAAAQVDPRHWKAFQSMGHCRYRQDRLGEALHYYEKSLALNPDNAELKRIADSLIASGVTAPAPTPPVPQVPTPKPTPSADRRGRTGFKAGLTWTRLSGTEGIDVKTATGYGGGAFHARRFTRRIFVQPELLVLTRKYSWASTSELREPYAGGVTVTTRTAEATVTSLAAEVPLLFHFLAAEKPPLIRLHAGPVAGFLLASRQKGGTVTVVQDVPDFGPILSSKTTETLDGDLKPFSKSFTAGAAGGLEVGIAGFLLDVRYTTGLTGAFKEGKAKCSVLSVLAGYGF